MLLSEYSITVLNGVQDEVFTDIDYLQLISKALHILGRDGHGTVDIRHKNNNLITIIRTSDNGIISVRFDKNLYTECSFTTLLNAYIGQVIHKFNNRNEENNNNFNGANATDTDGSNTSRRRFRKATDNC